MKLLLKRDIEQEGFPAAEQIDIGELVINSVTGRLYTKLVDGSVVEFISQKICFDPIPEISFFYENNAILPPDYLMSNFCCAGGLFTVTVKKLKPAPFDYAFSLTELTNNTVAENISVSDASFVSYSETDPDTKESISYRQATIPASISITDTNYNNISLFKFSIIDNITKKPIRGGERIFTIRCLESSI